MMDFISIPLVVGMITLGIYKLVELFVCRKERLTMIEKLGTTFNPSMIANKFSFPEQSGSKFWTLKIACLLLGVGLGLLVGFFIAQYYYGGQTINNDNRWALREMTGVIYGSSALLFGGLGLLIAFLLEMGYTRKNKE